MQKFRKGSYSVIRFSQRSFRTAWPRLFQSYEARVRNEVPSSVTEQWATKKLKAFFEWIFVKPLTLLPSHKRRTYLPQKTTQGHILFFFIFSGFLWLHSSLCPQIWPAHRIPFYTHHLNSIICMCSVTKSKEVHCKHAMPKNKWKFKQKTITKKALRKGSMFSYRMTVRVSLASDRTPCFP